MAIKPILFNTEMVRAILDGRKTCTRRTLKHPFIVHPNGYITKPRGNENLCPYDSPYQRGDILYVRETWKNAPNGYYYYENWQGEGGHSRCYELETIHPHAERSRTDLA